MKRNDADFRPFWALALVLVCLVAVSVRPAAAEPFEESLNFDSDRLVVRNLIGAFEIRGHDGPGFEVTVAVRGRDASRERIKLDSSGGSLTIGFPLKEDRSYVYPEMGSRKRVRIQSDSDGGSWFSALFGGGRSRIDITGSGSGLELWADVLVLVPRGASLEIDHGAGAIVAEGVHAALTLDSHWGSVRVADAEGRLVIDTGSGAVTAERVVGNIAIDTGSGRVDLRDCRGDEFDVDTGSGSVEVERLDGRSLRVDTGSGSVRAVGVRVDGADIDTGSGSVELLLERMGRGNFRLDTGSGSVTLGVPPGASADVEAETGSGGIRVELDDDVTFRRKERDEMSLRIGGGDASVSIDTGSGGIRIVHSP